MYVAQLLCEMAALTKSSNCYAHIAAQRGNAYSTVVSLHDAWILGREPRNLTTSASELRCWAVEDGLISFLTE